MGNSKKQFLDYIKQKNYKYVSLGQLVNDDILLAFNGYGSPKSQHKGKGDCPYIKTSDIIDFAIYKNPNNFVPEEIYHKIKGNKLSLELYDLLFVRRGSNRIGDLAMISPENINEKLLLMGEITVFRVINQDNNFGFNSFNLLYLLGMKQVKNQFDRLIFIDTTFKNMGNRWQEILIPVMSKTAMIEKGKEIKKIFMKKWDATKSLKEALFTKI